MVPAVERKARKLRHLTERLGRDRDIRFALQQHVSNFLRTALMQTQMDLGEFEFESLHHARQRIARLGMGGGDSQLPSAAIAVFLGEILDVLGIEQHALDQHQQFLAGLGEPQQSLALAHENIDAEFHFQIAYVFRHAGLRGVERVGGLGQVEIPSNRFPDDAQLLEIHGQLKFSG